jgi:hypothetical protein
MPPMENPSKKSTQTKKNLTESSESKVESQKEIIEKPKEVDLDKNLEKLISPREQARINENMDKILDYLKQLGIGEIDIDRSKFMITIPFEYENTNYLSHVIVSMEYFLVKCSILTLEGVSQQNLVILFFDLLKANFLLNSVTFSVDPEGKSIWAEADIPINVSFDIFKEEYFSIIFAIDYFLKNITSRLHIAPKPSHDKPPASLEGHPSLYI